MTGGSVYDVLCLDCGFRSIGHSPGEIRLDTCPNCEGRAMYRKAPAAAVALLDAGDELKKARAKFGPMHSAHEGHSVIREEFEELWTHVCADTGHTAAARDEAIQLAAMALRYVVDVCDQAVAP